MFCPNCGAQNQDTATACAKCGFALKSPAAAPKFKGTMLMMNAPQVPQPGAAPPAQPAAAPPPAAAAPAAPAAAPPAAAPVAASPKPKLKGTMIGVAPPSLGSNVPPGGAPAAAPGPAAFGAPPAGFGGPPPGVGAPAPAFEPPPAAPPPAAPAQQPSSAVNPLGGTMVADAGAFGGAFPGAPAAMGGGYDIGAPPPGFAAPPPAADPMMGQAPMAPPGAAPMVPQQSMDMMQDEPMPPIPGTVGGPNPIVTVLLIVLTCGIYGIYLLVKGKKQNVQ